MTYAVAAMWGACFAALVVLVSLYGWEPPTAAQIEEDIPKDVAAFAGVSIGAQGIAQESLLAILIGAGLAVWAWRRRAAEVDRQIVTLAAVVVASSRHTGEAATVAEVRALRGDLTSGLDHIVRQFDTAVEELRDDPL